MRPHLRSWTCPLAHCRALQRLCGIATVTDGFVQAVDGTPARILDTRKTAPGLRRWTSTPSPRAAAATTGSPWRRSRSRE
ncbi:hypothetical protein [Streptomyces sp. NPDC056723]|uniref:hypothetical protein n=1 Tax=Streptomyces sp. NPDC056723 TaxID=3345925 RepID=UPI0036906218